MKELERNELIAGWEHGGLPHGVAEYLSRLEVAGIIETQPSLEAVIARQVDRLIDRYGFHYEVYPDLSDAEAASRYRQDFALPEGAKHPENYHGRFDTVLAVESRLTPHKMHLKANIEEWTNIEGLTNTVDIPDRPFLIFTHNALRYIQFDEEKALQHFAEDEVGCTQIEVTNLYLQRPEYFTHRLFIGMSAPGSRDKKGNSGGMSAYFGQPGAGGSDIGVPARMNPPLSRGKEIIILGS